MRRLACLLLVVAMICPLSIVNVQAADDTHTTSLTSDATWTQGSYHKLSNILVIPAGVTLTVEPGVWVDLWDCRINVYGTLNASGTGDNKITFTSSINRNLGLYAYSIQPDGLWFDRASSGIFLNTCVVGSRMDISGSINFVNSSLQGFIEVDHGASTFTQNTITKINVFDGSTTLTNNQIDSLAILGGTPTVSNNLVNGDIYISGGSPTFTNNTIKGPTYLTFSNVYTMGSPVFSENTFFASLHGGSLEFDLSNAAANTITVANNFFDVSSGAAISMPSGPNVKVLNNKINGNDTAEIGVEVQGGSGPTVEVKGNEVSHCKTGLIIQPSNVRVSENSFYNNSIGISIYPLGSNQGTVTKAVSVHDNIISNNSVGIKYFACGPSINITNNGIYANTQYNLVLACNQNITVANNYWGTNDQDTIDQSIYDGKDDSNFGMVTYTPFTKQTSEQETTPDPTVSTSSQVATTTYLAVAIFSALIVAGIILLAIRRTKKN